MYKIGIDIGGTNTIIGLVNAKGICIKTISLKTQQYTQIESFINDIVTAVKSFQIKNNNLSGIGIGAPNGNYYTGNIEYAPNLPFEGVVPIKHLLERHFHINIALDNDANAAAYGEKIFGGARNIKDFIMITLGTGVGSGIVINNQLVHGHDGAAGELGHSIIIPNGRACTCGRNGCLEAYCAARGIVETYKEIQSALKTGLLSNTEITSKAIHEAALQNDPVALKTFDETGKILGLALSNAVCFSSPKAIFLMGGPVNAGEFLLRPLRHYFELYLLKIYQHKIAILKSELPENQVAILGSAALAEL